MKYFCNIIILSLLCFNSMAIESNKTVKLDELTEAYQREILFLSTYKKELIEKKQAMEKSLGNKLKSAKEELNLLESQWLAQQASNERLMQKLTDIERDFDNKKENKEILETTLRQAALENKQQGREDVVDNRPLLEKMTSTFEQALFSLKQSTQVTKKSGKFYSKDGEEQVGELISLGSVAQFAEQKGRVAALYPTGAGHFRVWSWIEGSTKSLSEMKIPESLTFFLYENPNKEFNAQKDKTWMDTLKAGGLIGWFILIMGAFALIISIIRFSLLTLAEPKKTHSLEEVLEKVRTNDIDGAQHLLIRENNSVSRVLNKTLSFLRTEPEKVEDAIMEAILKEYKTIDRFGVAILVIASVAPLMGLLGTVTGMISTFDIITLYGTGNPKLLSGGISEALVTTMFGLIVAIPALLIGQFLNSKTDNIKSDMEKWALATCNAYKNRGDKVS